jgi:hypothetical protein
MNVGTPGIVHVVVSCDDSGSGFVGAGSCILGGAMRSKICMKIVFWELKMVKISSRRPTMVGGARLARCARPERVGT